MKISLSNITNGQNVSAINNNFALIEDALNNGTLYRDNPVGEPNEMDSTLDMNGQKLINLAAPLNPNDAARLTDVQATVIGGTANLVKFTPYGIATGTNVQLAIQNVVDNFANYTVSYNTVLTGNTSIQNLQVGTSISGLGFQNYLASPPGIGTTSPNVGSFTNLSASGSLTGLGFTSLLTSPVAIGSVTPNTGAFTNLSASGTISGTGFTTYLSSPPPIGNTVANSGAFSTLSASGAVSGVGFSNYLASPPAIGGTVPNTGAFTTLSTSGLATLNSLSTGNATISGGSISATPISGSTGSFTTIAASGTITPNPTAGIVGTTAVGNAQSGSVGEYLTSTQTGVSLSSGVTANVTSMTLLPGDWDVGGIVQYTPAASTTVASVYAGVNTTSAALGTFSNYSGIAATMTTGANQNIVTPVQRINVSTNTTVYLIGLSSFGASTMTCSGFIWARRRR